MKKKDQRQDHHDRHKSPHLASAFMKPQLEDMAGAQPLGVSPASVSRETSALMACCWLLMDQADREPPPSIWERDVAATPGGR